MSDDFGMGRGTFSEYFVDHLKVLLELEIFTSHFV